MSTPVEQIKERLSVVDVVSSYLKLEKAGTSFKAKCPFHNEKTPSFFVSPSRGSYYCFGCNAKGDIFTFVQEFEGLDFIGALRVLAQRAGVTLTKVDPKVRSQYARLYLCLEKATRFYEETLKRDSEVQQYLSSRGLKPEMMQEWRLGFAPNDWRQLHDYLLKEGFSQDEMVKVGLIKSAVQADPAVRAGSKKYYDTFRGRVLFPIRDSASRVIAFSGRILPKLDDGKTGKYINSPETILFNKSETLYGFDKAKLVIRQKDAAILVEGQMDLLMAHQAGYENTVASSGTALTERQLERLKRLSENLLIAFDSDSAGVKAAERAIRLALALGTNVKVIALREKDPADLILHDRVAWERAVSEAKHVIEFLLDALLSREKDGRARALAIEKTLLPLLRLLPSSVEQSHFLKTIAEKSGLREDALWDTFKKLPTPAQTSSLAETKAQKPIRPQVLVRRVFGVLFLAESRGDTAYTERLKQELLRIFGEEALKKRTDYFAPMKDTLLLEGESYYGEGKPAVQEEQELLRHLEEEYLTALLSEAMDALSAKEREGKKDESRTLLQKCKDLTQKLATLKSARFSQ